MAADLLRKVNLILSRKLSDFDSGLEYVAATGRVMGFVVSSDFRGPDHAKRQRRLKTALAGDLSPQELRNVGPIVTMNPVEARHSRELELEDAG
jgi:hypothetical protein